MPLNLKNYSRNVLKDSFVWRLREEARGRRALDRWEASGKPAPPPEYVKRKILSSYARAFGPTIMIETGTYLGDTPFALRNHFQKIFSIELSTDLAERAKKRFRSLPQIQIIQGDSGEILPALLREISVPCLLWLDGHYSAGVTARGNVDTPIMKELETVFAHSEDHIILIDDARLFTGADDYPTMEALRNLFKERRPGHEFAVINDVIRSHRPQNLPSKY